MKDLPHIFIMGRQNVGKSTLFNSILRKNVSITQDTPGVTRDVIKFLVEKEEFPSAFYLCDTPGLDLDPNAGISKEIWDIAKEHLQKADLILLVIDAFDLRSYDYDLIHWTKKDPHLSQIPVITLVNKVDQEKEELDLEPFYRLGIQEILPISALHKRNLPILLQKIKLYLPKEGKKVSQSYCKIAILGKPNSGKSSLLNAFMGYSRALVSEVPGTTRDAVSDTFGFQGKQIEIIDTAGIRRKSKSEEGMEFFSYRRTQKALEEAHVVLLLVDAQKGFGEFDKKIFGEIQAAGKPLVVVVNKWDLVPEKETNSWKKFVESICAKLPALKERPFVSISAKEKQRIHKLLELSLSLYEKSQKKITTRALNDWLGKWKGKMKVQKASHRPPKVFYATQTSSNPFEFLFFVNDTKLFPSHITSFYRKNIIDEFGLEGLSVEIALRNRSEGSEERT